MFLEGFAHRAIGIVAGRHIDQIDPAQLRGNLGPKEMSFMTTRLQDRRYTKRKSRREMNWQPKP